MDITAQIPELELELCHTAMNWRAAKHVHKTNEMARLVTYYHDTMAKLQALGWKGEGLLPDEMLPDRLMPAWYKAQEEEWAKQRRPPQSPQ